MSRSALVAAVLLVAIGAFVWLQSRDEPAPPASAETPPAAGPAAAPETAPVLPVVVNPSSAPPEAPAGQPRISSRDELAEALKARGYDADRLIAAYRDWRVARGFLGADPLTGVTAENAPSQVYAAMDRATQKSLADSGDMGAMQAYAAGSLPADPATAAEYYGQAAEAGSAAAMLELANVLADIELQNPGGPGDDPSFHQRLLALRGGDPARDLRQDSLAWTLAAIRLHGPLLATSASLARVQELERNPDRTLVTTICGKSLAILADLSAANAGRYTASLPPAFVAESNVYGRLPCRDTPAPVTPPRALETCRSSPATGSAGQPLELWICQGN